MKIIIKGKEYNLVEFKCNPRESYPLYINITNACNAKCAFCSNGKNKKIGDLDLKLLKEIMDDASKGIRRISITGGEPLIESKKIKDLLEVINPYNVPITMNTNGKFLPDTMEMLNKYDNLKEIHLSRHHYDDSKNDELFGIKTLPFSEINNINTKGNIVINCLLIKGYIDSKEEIINFLEKVSETNIKRVGFVSMMNVNDYTNNKFIDYRDIKFSFTDRLLNILNVNDGERCSCNNYAYLSKNGKKIIVFFRYTKEIDNDEHRSLMFDYNGLKEGF